MQKLRFANAKEYLQQMHPEYNFVFTIAQRAVAYWSYEPDRARESQENMERIACEHARQHDLARGLEVIVEDGSCRDGANPNQTGTGPKTL